MNCEVIHAITAQTTTLRMQLLLFLRIEHIHTWLETCFKIAAGVLSVIQAVTLLHKHLQKIAIQMFTSVKTKNLIFALLFPKQWHIVLRRSNQRGSDIRA